MRVGAHISTGGSFPGAVRAISELGGNAVQLFSRNPRGGRARKLPPGEVHEFARVRESLGVETCVLHAPYTVNPASAKPEVREFGTGIVALDLVRGALLGVDILVMHPGSHGGAGVERGIELSARCLGEARARASAEVGRRDLPLLVLENMSGSGTEVGGELRHLHLLREALGDPSWLRFCLDTAHAHGAGYDLSREDGLEALFDDWEREVGLDRMVMVHLNDSAAEAGSHRDRHAVLGEGSIGRMGLSRLLADPRVRALPLIIESPVEKQEDYAGEIAKVRAWAEEGGST